MTPAHLAELQAAWPGEWREAGNMAFLDGPKLRIGAEVATLPNGGRWAKLHVLRPVRDVVLSQTFAGAVRALKRRLRANINAQARLLEALP